jgi:SAM-dependent methyltransferase
MSIAALERIRHLVDRTSRRLRMSNVAASYASDLLPFTAHRVELSPGVWTIPDGGDDPLLALSTQILVDRAGGTLRGKRVLDIGCLEGGYSAAFARLGAREAVGLEIRDSNLARCRFLKEHLRLENLTFRQGDAKKIARADLGAFDIVFAAGLLYHLDDPFDFLRRAHDVTDDLLLLDTHVAVPHAWGHACADRMSARVWGERSYVGREMYDYPPDLSPEELDKRHWSSHGNPNSFWLTEESLVDVLWDVGFPYVSKVYMKRPYRDPERCTWECRVIVVAKKAWRAG